MPCPNPNCESVGTFEALDPQPPKAFRMGNARPLANSKCTSCEAQFSEHFLIRSLFNFKNAELPADQRFSPVSTALFDPPRDIPERESFSRDVEQFPTNEDGGHETNLFGKPFIISVVDLSQFLSFSCFSVTVSWYVGSN